MQHDDGGEGAVAIGLHKLRRDVLRHAAGRARHGDGSAGIGRRRRRARGERGGSKKMKTASVRFIGLFRRLSPIPIADDSTALHTVCMTAIGIIGGSGLYQIDGLTDVEWRHVWSPFGDPSDELCFGRLGDVQVVFLPRHGRGHTRAALRDQLPRQYRRAEARRASPKSSRCRRSAPQRRSAARHLRAGRSVHRPHLRPRQKLFRHGLRRACLDGASGVLAGSANGSLVAAQAAGFTVQARRHVSGDGRSAILDRGRIATSIAAGVAT